MLNIVEMPRERKSEDVSLMQGVANRIRAVMKARGLNQGQVATYAGVPPGVLSTLLKGTKDQAAFSTVFKLAKGLGMSLDELAGLTPLQNLEPPVVESTDRLQSLESRFDTLQGQFERLLEAMEKEEQTEAAPRGSRSKAAGKRKRAS